MNAKTMEGLVGAGTNMELLNTPFRVYKEARRRGDTATMERAMGYVNEFSNRADEYKTKADEGMKEDAEEAREKAELEREKAIQTRKEEREKLENRIEEGLEKRLGENIEGNKDKNEGIDTVEVSEEGKLLLKNMAADRVADNETTISVKDDMEPVIYTKSGEVSQTKQVVGISVSV